MTTHMILASVTPLSPQPDAVTAFIDEGVRRFVAAVDAAPDASLLRSMLGLDA